MSSQYLQYVIPQSSTLYSTTPLSVLQPVKINTIRTPYSYSPVNLYEVSKTYDNIYIDNGLGESPIVRYDITKETRNQFLNKWLYRYPDILNMLIVKNGKVSVASKEEMKTNETATNTRADLEEKSSFIGYEILTFDKCKKILSKFCIKNTIGFYDIPHNHNPVKKTLAHYVKKHLREMQLY